MKKFVFLICLSSIVLLSSQVFAQEDVQALKKEIEVLKKRIQELESAQENTQRQERFPRGKFDFGDGEWDPFSEMEQMNKEIDTLFRDSFWGEADGGRSIMPEGMMFQNEVEIQELDGIYQITLNMSGINKEKLDLKINEHSITIKGERSTQTTEESQNRFYQAQSYGTFMKTIPLPVDADTAKLETKETDTALIITIPKK